ncbi:Silent information regulator protein Sir2 [Paludibacter propionicigenes WB4]|uniref:NAD-dependent protein deacylase n=1 Tax=Paludibacter propionicigenes (strain DSM 17365 / JCM 13257 / WB4) TaxID=694427 RepID=E4T558_PALPW|nr:NAD-dependent deacylase [Paludibacter propionicigenes]ADQ79852.1 Silent information regulator protein Sir2 [Paludibacter propionicigenes WB4]
MKKLVVLTGAGMSAESGISTFRDAGGLWEQHRVEDVATPQGWSRNPALVLDFYNQRRKQLLECKPNAGHLALAELEKSYEVRIITQNVDNLHEQAGSSHVLHLHGELMKVRSTSPSEEVFELDTDNYETHLGDKCPKGFQLRPHIVWFGEAVPEIENAIRLTEKADILVIIGTSMQVYPAASLINYIKPNTPVYLIDPHEVNVFSSNVTVIKKGASVGMKELSSILINASV